MNKETAIKLFESKQIRSLWNDDEEKWYFSIVDVIEILTGTDRPRKYWSDLKSKLKKEGSELSEKIGRLKMLAEDGKFYATDVADTKQLFRLIQSIPSKKAEPFKQWLAKVGSERIDEIEDPELGFDRLMETYLKNRLIIILDKIFAKLFLIIDLNCIFAVHKNENQSLC